MRWSFGRWPYFATHIFVFIDFVLLKEQIYLPSIPLCFIFPKLIVQSFKDWSILCETEPETILRCVFNLCQKRMLELIAHSSIVMRTSPFDCEKFFVG